MGIGRPKKYKTEEERLIGLQKTRQKAYKKYNNSEKQKKCMQKYLNSDNYLKRIPSIRKSQKEYLRNQRNAAIEILGNVCVRCGFGDRRAIQIDHINGGGSKERKERKYKGNFYKNVINSVLSEENKYQLLCANCNWIKRYENNEHKG